MATASAYKVDVKFFFDRAYVQKRLNEKEVRDLSRIGAFARTVVRRSMRPGGKGGKVSKPGEPPRTHTRALRDGVIFAYQESTHSVVIGPRKLNGKRNEGVPKLLNEGGTQLVPERIGNRDRFGRRIVGKFTSTGRKVRAKYQARPYIGPAAKTWEPILAKWREITGRSNL